MKIETIISGTEFENLQVDYKICLEKDKPISWVKSLVAFANCGGGFLAIGVSNSRDVVGLSHSDVDDSKELVNRYVDRMVRPGLFKFSFTPMPIGGDKYILLVNVPDSIEITFAREGDYRETIYVRHDGQSVPATIAEIGVLMRTKRTLTYDSESSGVAFKAATFKELEAKAFERKGETVRVDLNLAKSLGLADLDGKLTNCGLLFSDQCGLDNSNIHMRKWPGLDSGGSTILDDKEFKGSLLYLYDRMMAFARANTSVGYIKKYGGHDPLESYPDRALHEAFVNALAHRDYLIDGCQIDIDIYSDRMEIGVPGSFLVSGEASSGLLRKMHSERRNKSVCDVFTYLKMMEKSGQGFNNIVDSYKEFDSKLSPTYKALPGYFTLTLFDTMFKQYFEPKSDVGELAFKRLIAGNRDYDEAILELCFDEPKRLQELMALTKYKSHSTFMSSVINPLLDAGLLISTSAKRSPTTKYATNTDLVKKK